MLPGQYTLRVHQGTAFDWAMTWYDDNDAIVDLTTYEAILQVRRRLAAQDVIAELDSREGQITLSDTSPNLVAHITRDFLISLPSDNREQEWEYGLKLFLTGPSNAPMQTLLEGPFIVRPSVARRPAA